MQKRKQQLDKYIPLEYKWINKHTMHFSGNIELKHFVHNEWIPKGIWGPIYSFLIIKQAESCSTRDE